MKRLFVFLSLLMMVNVQAAAGDDMMSELQRALARRRAANNQSSDSGSAVQATTPATRVAPPVAPRPRAASVVQAGAAAAARPVPVPAPRPRVAPQVAPRPGMSIAQAEAEAAIAQALADYGAEKQRAADRANAQPGAAAAASAASVPVPAPRSNCSICMEVPTGDKIKLQCGHQFHKDCIKPWVSEVGRDSVGRPITVEKFNPSCPNCRAPLTREDKINIGIAPQVQAGGGAVDFSRYNLFGGLPVHSPATGELVAIIPIDNTIEAMIRARAANLQLQSLRREDQGRAAAGRPVAAVEDVVHIIITPEPGSSLNLSGRGISDISRVLQRLTLAEKRRIKRLDLSRNNITEIPYNAFDGFENLEELNLSHNQLVRLREGCFNGLANRHFRRLDLSYNRISSIDPLLGLSGPDMYHGFNVTSDIQELDLSHNQLSDFPVKFFARAMPSIQNLNLSYNNINNVPTQLFHDLPALRELNIMGNPLTGDISLNAVNLPTIRALRRVTGFPGHYLAHALVARTSLNVPRDQRLQTYPDSSWWAQLDVPGVHELLDRIIHLLSGS